MPQPSQQETLARGTVLDGRYRIERVIGSGGYASVYKALDMTYNVERAIKEVTDPDKGVREQFRLEADLLINHDHPNIPHGYNVLEVGKRIYFVMEFVGGKDLEELLNESLTQQRRPLDEARVLRWAIEICSALNVIHRLPTPIIHRDIKPANIKITPDDRPVLIDFGLAKLQQGASKATQVAAQGVSPGFAPPEQYMAKGRTDARTDIYGLGATLYACLTGRDPAEAPARLLQQTGVSHGTSLDSPRTLNPRISARTEAIILKALELSPSKRQQSAAELESELRESLKQLTGATPASPTAVMPSAAAPGRGAATPVDMASGKRPAAPKPAPTPVAPAAAPVVAATLQQQPARPGPFGRGANKPAAANVDTRTGKQPAPLGAPVASVAAPVAPMANRAAVVAPTTETGQHRTLAAAQPGAPSRSSGKHPVAPAAAQKAPAQPLVGMGAAGHAVLQLKTPAVPAAAGATAVAATAATAATAAVAVAEKEKSGKVPRVSAKRSVVSAKGSAVAAKEPLPAPADVTGVDPRAWIRFGTTPISSFGKWMLALSAIEAIWGTVALSLGVISVVNHGIPSSMLPQLALGWLLVVAILSLVGGQALSRPIYRRGALGGMRRAMQGTGLFLFSVLVHLVALWGATIFISTPGNELLAVVAYIIFGVNVLVAGGLSVFNILD
ncbi:MAG TPA: protein kinase [Ktedonobacterales bacterium]